MSEKRIPTSEMPTSKPTRENASGRNRIWLALLASATLHIPILFSDLVGDLLERIPNITHRTRERTKNLLHTTLHPKEKEALVQKLNKQIEAGETIDYGSFFIEVERAEGLIDEAEAIQAEAALNDAIKRFKDLAEQTSDQPKILNQILDEQGEYSEANSYLGTLLIDKKGNCDARTKWMLSVVSKVYPTLPLQLQTMKIDGRMHIRALAHIDGEWNALDGNVERLKPEDLTGTILNPTGDFVNSYIGKPSHSKLIVDENTAVNLEIRIMVSDAYLSPDNNVSDLLRLKNFQSKKITAFSMGGFSRFSKPSVPIELTLLTDDEIKALNNKLEEKNRPKREKNEAIVQHLKTLDRPEKVEAELLRIAPHLSKEMIKELAVPLSRWSAFARMTKVKTNGEFQFLESELGHTELQQSRDEIGNIADHYYPTQNQCTQTADGECIESAVTETVCIRADTKEECEELKQISDTFLID